MASTYSTDLKLELMVTGENAGTWGTKTNTNLNLLQQSIAGVQGIDVSASDVTLVMSNAQLSNARNMVLVLNGSLAANRQVLIPNGIEKFYIIHDQTVRNGYSLTIKTVSGSGFAMETTSGASDMVACYSDGTDVYEVSLNTLSGSIAAAQLDSFAVTSTKLASFAVTSAKVASYAVTSNKLATNAVTAVKIANSTITLNKLSATGSPSASTYLRGDNTWGAISSSPAALKSNITLKTAASITAGKLASINSSGEIVNLPTLNTYGTVRTNSSATGGSTYQETSLDGSTALRVVNAFNSPTYTATYYGSVISNSGTPTNGGTTVTNSISGGGQYGGLSNMIASILPIGNNTFLVMQVLCSYNGGQCASGTYFRSDYFIITVDPSTGNLTKGAVVSNAQTAGSSFGISYWYAAQVNKNILINYTNAGGTSSGFLVKNLIVTWSGTTVTITTDTTDVPFWYQTNGFNSFLTSNNILCLGVPNTATWRTASWTASPPAIGTKTDTTMVGDYYDSGAWWKMEDFSATGADYVLFTYRNTSLEYVYNTFSVNQTTGALTSVETGNSIAKLGNNSFLFSTFKNSSSQVYSSSYYGTTGSLNSVSWTNGVANGFNANGYITMPYSVIRLNSGDLYYLFSYNTSGFPTNQGYTVNAYSTDNFNYVGVVDATTSSSPASIVTDGVAANFTSLTPGTLYYATSPYDGSVVTSSASGLLVGKAISSTQILLQRSNTQ